MIAGSGLRGAQAAPEEGLEPARDLARVVEGVEGRAHREERHHSSRHQHHWPGEESFQMGLWMSVYDEATAARLGKPMMAQFALLQAKLNRN